MRTPLQAMLWELWRLSRLELLGRISYPCALILAAFLFSSGVFDFSIGEGWYVIRAIVILLLSSTSVLSVKMFNAFDNLQQGGFCFHLGYARPTSTTQLVVVPMLYIVVTVVACFVLPALFFCLLMDTSLPLVGIGTGVACVATCLIAAAWSPPTQFGRIAGLLTIAIGVVLCLVKFHSHYDGSDPWLYAMGKPGYFVFAWYYYGACLGISVAATVVAVAGVQRQRRGDEWGLVDRWVTGESRFWNRSRKLASPATKPFSNRFAAQWWYEMRRVGRPGWGFALLPLYFFCFLWIVSRYVDPEKVAAIWIGVLALCPFFYQLASAEGALGLRTKQGARQFSTFDATRSMSNDALIAVKLLVDAACSLIGWLCMAMAAGLHTVLVGNWHEWARIGEAVSTAVGDVPGYWWVVGLLNIVLLYVSSSSILLAVGMWMQLYKKLFAFGFFLLLLHVGALFWDAKHDWAYRHLWAAYGYFLSVVIVVVCILAMRKALTAGYLGKRLFGYAFCLWVVYVSSVVALYMKSPAVTIPLPFIALGVSILLVPLASTAAAPLALASFRHA